MKKLTAVIIVLVIILGFSLWHRSQHKLHSMQIFLMDTIVELQLVGPDSQAARAMKAAVEELKRVDGTFGYQNSLLMQLNASHTLSNKELYDLIAFSLDVYRSSQGAFSLTLRPVLDAWGFSGTHPYRIPTREEFAHWKSLPDDSSISLLDDGQTIQTLDNTEIDLGGVAKGYAADRAVAVMKEYGITTGLINAGGDIMAFGDRTWRIGIKHPRKQGTFTTIEVKNAAVATSGDYERYFVEQGVRYCHILDPSSGWPAQRYMSVTIVADTCTQADAWATALFVRGTESLKGILKEKGIEWVAIDREGNVEASDSLKKYCPSRLSDQ